MTKKTHLYHYTCTHAWPKIQKARQLIPMPQPILAEPLIWLTTLDVIDEQARDALGLTSNLLSCDRTQVRVDVGADCALPWNVYANAANVPKYIRNLLETLPADPASWWISTSPIPLTRMQLLDAALMARGAVRT